LPLPDTHNSVANKGRFFKDAIEGRPPAGRSCEKRRRADSRIMVYKLGRLLQFVGLILLPVAMAGNLVPEQAVSLGNMLTLMIVGVMIFFLGWTLQQVGKR